MRPLPPLHLLEKVQGTAHLEVPEAEALALMAILRQRLPGYLVSKLVREIAGDTKKGRWVSRPGASWPNSVDQRA